MNEVAGEIDLPGENGNNKVNEEDMNFPIDGPNEEPQSSSEKPQNLDSLAQSDVVDHEQTDQSAGSDVRDI